MAAVTPAKQVIRRAMLYVPGSSPRFLQKSRTLPSLDTICYDLEDSVTPSLKAASRTNILNTLNLPRLPHQIREQAVRINAVDSGLALDDLTTILQAQHIDTLVIPKVDSPKDLHFVTDVLRHILPSRHPSTPTAAEDPTSPPPIRLIALIESARSLLSLPAICTASPYLDGLVFAAEDFARDLSLTRTPDLTEFLYARSAIVTAARAHAIPSVLDLVATTFRGEEGRRALADECRAGSRLGFNGKQCIHPDQVAVAQEAFAPAAEEVEWAVRVLVCDAKAGVGEGGRAAWTLDGKMVDVPVVGRARGLVERARGCGVDVDAVWERFREEEPQ